MMQSLTSSRLTASTTVLKTTINKNTSRTSIRPSRRTSILNPVKAFRENEEQPYKVANGKAIPAFTRRRERTVGRLASLGVAAAWIGEVWTGMGPLTQVSYDTGVPMNLVYASTFALAAFQLFLGLSPASSTFDQANQRDVSKRNKGFVGDQGIEPDVSNKIQPAEEPGKLFLRGELFLGRAAMLIFAGACLAEALWGGEAPLAHLGFITPGQPWSQGAPLLLKLATGLFLFNGIGLFSGFNSNKASDTY